MTFYDLKFGPRRMGLSGIQAAVFFSNGYGASVIKGYGSYGVEDDLYELAVLKQEEDDSWELCYDSGITDDVLGQLNEEEITSYLQRIETL